MKIDTSLNIIEYVNLVNGIADKYFNENHEYQPHIGMVESMRLFYAICVKESEFDSTCPHDTVEIKLLEPVLSNSNFINAYNDALAESTGYQFNFACAYRDAMSIVEAKKYSLYSVTGQLGQILLNLIDRVSSTISNENIEKILSFSNSIQNGDVDYYKLLETLADSPLFQEALKKNRSENNKKVVSINESKKYRNNKKNAKKKEH